MALKLNHTLLALLCFTLVNAQNLVPMGGFEYEDSCVVSGFQANVPPSYPYNRIYPFYAPSDGSPDIFKNCDMCGVYCSPENQFGNQYPHSGLQYGGFSLMAYDAGPLFVNWREYISVKLSDTLEKGWYCFSVYWSLADKSGIAIDGLGAAFHADSISICDNGYGYHLMPLTPQVENPAGNVLNDKDGWTEFKGIFKATGNERYLTVGNFKHDSLLTIEMVGGPTQDIYYYIDDISLYKCDSTLSIGEFETERIEIYPNPAQDFVSIKLPNSSKQTQLRIYNLTGQLITQKPITTNQQVPITGLSNGMYIFVVQSDDKIIGRQRVIVYR